MVISDQLRRLAAIIDPAPFSRHAAEGATVQHARQEAVARARRVFDNPDLAVIPRALLEPFLRAHRDAPQDVNGHKVVYLISDLSDGPFAHITYRNLRLLDDAVGELEEEIA